MRILFSSDLHASRPAFDLFAEALAMGPYEVGILAGDLLDDFGLARDEGNSTSRLDKGGFEEGSRREILALEAEIKSMLAAVGKPILIIPGNHDLTPWEDYGSVINIHGKRVDLDGYSFVGYRWTSLEKSLEEQRADLEEMESLVDRKTILVTHEPAFGRLDNTDYDSVHFGSKAIARFMFRTRPRYHLFGHVHGAFGVRRRSVNGSYPNARAFFDIEATEGIALAVPAEIAVEDEGESRG